MNASQVEVQLILNAIDDVRVDVASVRQEVKDARAETATMDRRINGRIRKLEDDRLLRMTFLNVTKLVVPGVAVGVLIAIIAPLVGG